MTDRPATTQQLDDFSVKLFKYLDTRFDQVNQRINELGAHVNSLHGLVEAYSKEVEIYQHEALARDAQVDRLQRWVEQLAAHTDMPLTDARQ